MISGLAACETKFHTGRSNALTTALMGKCVSVMKQSDDIQALKNPNPDSDLIQSVIKTLPAFLIHAAVSQSAAKIIKTKKNKSPGSDISFGILTPQAQKTILSAKGKEGEELVSFPRKGHAHFGATFQVNSI